MLYILLIMIAVFAASLISTPLVRTAAQKLKLLDFPGERKVHAIPIPRVGGIAVLGSALLGLFLGHWLIGNAAFKFPHEGSLILALGLILLVGLIDDIFRLNAWIKLLGEIAAALLLWFSGLRIHDIHFISFNTALAHFLSLVVTVLWLVACANAINLIDGVDGLATGVALVATTALFIPALHAHIWVLVVVLASLGASLLGFLIYNFSPASIFLGDCGSLTIGFLLGVIGLVWQQKSTTLIGLTVPLLALGLPLLDTSIAIVRRALVGESIFKPDRRHIHHRLLALGNTPRRAVLLLYGVSALFAILSLLAAAHMMGLVVVLLCIMIWLGLQGLGYEEFNEIRLALSRGLGTRRSITRMLQLNQAAAAAAETSNLESFYAYLSDIATLLGASSVYLHWKDVQAPESSAEAGLEDLGGVGPELRHEISLSSAPTCWMFYLPLSLNGVQNGGDGNEEQYLIFRFPQPGTDASIVWSRAVPILFRHLCNRAPAALTKWQVAHAPLMAGISAEAKAGKL